MDLIKCSRCHEPFGDMRIEIQLQTGVERRRSDLQWEQISNMTLQSREVICPACFDKFAIALESLNVEMDKKERSATEIFDTAPAAAPPRTEEAIQPSFSTLIVDPTTITPFSAVETPTVTPSTETRHSLTRNPLQLSADDKPITFTESLHPPVWHDDPTPQPGLDEDPMIDQLIQNIRYADEPLVVEHTIRDEAESNECPVQTQTDSPPRPFGIPRAAVHTSSIS